MKQRRQLITDAIAAVTQKTLLTLFQSCFYVVRKIVLSRAFAVNCVDWCNAVE